MSTVSATDPKQNQSIWLTSRIRMISESKARRRSNLSLLILTYYSVLSVIVSVFGDYYKHHFEYIDQIGIAFSVVVLAASLVIGGFRFEGVAENYRSCYLKLQKLDKSEASAQEKERKYAKILEMYPNHSTFDYNDFIFVNRIVYKKDIENNGGKICCTVSIFFGYLARKIAVSAILLCLFFGPLVLLATPIVQALK